MKKIRVKTLRSVRQSIKGEDGGCMKQNIVHSADLDQEILDIVDVSDQVITTMPRSLVYQQHLYAQIRSVWLIIKNQEGKLWIPRRSWDLQQLPGYLDCSVSGHVQAGESYEQALAREALEEIGCDIAELDYRLIGKLTPHEHQAFSFSMVYECSMTQHPENFNRAEICEWQWLSVQELHQLYLQGEKIKSNLPVILKHFYPPFGM